VDGETNANMYVCTGAEAVTEIFIWRICALYWKTEDASQNNLFPGVHRQTGTEKFLVLHKLEM